MKKVYYAETNDQKWLWWFWATEKEIAKIIGKKGKIIKKLDGKRVGRYIYTEDGRIHALGNYKDKTVLTPYR